MTDLRASELGKEANRSGRGRYEEPLTANQLRNGKIVADETIKDSGEKLRIEWLPGTYVDVPFTPP